ncbi:MAG: HAMP domain-containing histidine kinase [Burkholderiales bacterium]|nr:HAMP domain-containing histidine kinase [Burkholderiales bacterium]
MIPPSFLRSTSFRLAALYAIVFGASVAVLLLSVYWSSVSAFEQQIDESVRREVELLVNIHRARGADGATRAIRRRIATLEPPRRYYLLQDASGRRIAGNLPPMAPLEGRTLMSVPVTDEDRAASQGEPVNVFPVVAVGRRLSGGLFLLVGENRFRAVKAEEAILLALGWGIAITVILALGGGALVAAGFLRRIEEINRTTRSIIEGNLSNRMLTRGGGDEMDRLAVNLNAMLDRIQSLMEGLKRVSDDIAHDLRTPLARLRQRLEIARERAATAAEFAAVMDQSIAEVDAILDTFSALLRIAQIESGTRRGAFSEVNMEAVVATVAETYVPVAEDSGHRLLARVGDACAVHGDRGLITQLAANLVENSIRHCPAGATITLALDREGGRPVLRVADTGPGVPQAEREKVFRRFYRLEASRTTPGSGLGLALVKAVADLHGASIELADNRPGLRVTVRFRAPAQGAEAPAGAAPEGAPELLREPN